MRALVLSGGSIKGAYQAGAIVAVMELAFRGPLSRVFFALRASDRASDVIALGIGAAAAAVLTVFLAVTGRLPSAARGRARETAPDPGSR